MKTVRINKLKKNLLIVELQTDVINSNYHIQRTPKGILIKDDVDEKFLSNKYTLLGKPDEIREEDAKELVRSGSYTTTFWNHKTNDNHKSNQLKTATESLLSAIETVVFWENQKTFGDFLYSPKEWEAVERNTFDRNRTLIFVKN